MKRFLFFLCLFAFAAQPAAAWSHWKAFRPVPGPGEKPFLIHRLAGPFKSDKITFCLEDNLKRKERGYYAAMVQKSLRLWFTRTADYIRQSGREREFGNVLYALDHAPAVTQVPCPAPDAAAQPDLRIFIGSRQDIQKKVPGLAHGAFKWDRSILYMDTTFFEEEKFERTMTHEFGHALGLADRYNPAAGTDGSAFYSTVTFYPAMMSTAYDIECDDAEGVINLLDRVVPSARSRTGWKTICKEHDQDPLTYRDGMPDPVQLFPDKQWIGAGAQQIAGKTAYFSWDADAFAPDSPLLFAAPAFAARTLNAQGLPAFTKSKNGTRAFYFYGQQSIGVLLAAKDCENQPFEEGLTACRVSPEEEIILRRDEKRADTFLWHKTRRQLINRDETTNIQRFHNFYADAEIRLKSDGGFEARVTNRYSDAASSFTFTANGAGRTVRESVSGAQRKRNKNGAWSSVSSSGGADALEAAAKFENIRKQVCADDCQGEIIHLMQAARKHFRAAR